MFDKLYNAVLKLALHRYAERYLAFVSFIESIFFPIPADVMLAPMCLANRQKAIRYAIITSVFSVLGGALGYGLGYFFSEPMLDFLKFISNAETIDKVKRWYDEYGFWLVFVAGFTPVPYKVFTILSGIMMINFPIFILASAISRPLRFFMVALAIYFGGEKLEKTLNKYVEVLGWLCVIGLAILIFFI